MWNQYYVSANKKLQFDGDLSFTAQFDSYITRASGASRAGPVHNNAVAASLKAQKGASSLMLGYQVIDGDEFMDYTQETAGIYLSNAMGVDFNGPHERSVQLRYMFDGNRAGMPGWTVMAWTVRGGHREWAVKTAYEVKDGLFKGAKIAFYVYRTRVDRQYPSKSFNDVQLMINHPIRMF